jgi:transposase
MVSRILAEPDYLIYLTHQVPAGAAGSARQSDRAWTRGLADWISGHVGAFEAIGGVPALLVPDNTGTAVIKAGLYDLQINCSYAEMAAHYGTAILPARPRRPATTPRSSSQY